MSSCSVTALGVCWPSGKSGFSEPRGTVCLGTLGSHSQSKLLGSKCVNCRCPEGAGSCTIACQGSKCCPPPGAHRTLSTAASQEAPWNPLCLRTISQAHRPPSEASCLRSAVHLKTAEQAGAQSQRGPWLSWAAPSGHVSNSAHASAPWKSFSSSAWLLPLKLQRAPSRVHPGWLCLAGSASSHALGPHSRSFCIPPVPAQVISAL